MIDSDLININKGFTKRDGKKIYTSLLSYIKNNKEKIIFQKHPLGFKYFKLGKVSKTEEFRLHFWIGTNENQDDDLQVHDHSFHFDSFIVYGELKNTKFISKKNVNSIGFIYDVEFKNENSRLVLNSNEQSLEIVEQKVIKSGEFYYLHSNELHKSDSIKHMSVSLLKITKPINKVSRVFSPKQLNSITSFKRTSLPGIENLELIHQLVDKIKIGRRDLIKNL